MHLDDIDDDSEQVAAQLGLDGVEAPMEQAVELTEVLLSADVLSQACPAVR